MDEEITKDSLYKWLMVVVFLGVMAIMTIYIAGLKSRLDALERKTAEQQTIQETRMDQLNIQVEAIQEEMNYGFEEQQKQIDGQAEQIAKTKQIVSTTNKAFTRFQNQQNKVEEELREELKKDQSGNVKLEPKEGNKRFRGRMQYRSAMAATFK